MKKGNLGNIVFTVMAISISSFSFASNDQAYDLYKIELEKAEANHERHNEKLDAQYSVAKEKIKSEYSLSKGRLSMIYDENIHQLERDFKENYDNKLDDEYRNKKNQIEADYKSKKSTLDTNYNSLSKEQKTSRRDSYKSEKSALYEQRKASTNSLYSIKKELKSYYYDLKKIAKNELHERHDRMKEELEAEESIGLAKLERNHARLIAYSYNQFSPMHRELRKRLLDETLVTFSDNETDAMINEKLAEPPHDAILIGQVMDSNFAQEIQVTSTKFNNVVDGFVGENHNETDSGGEVLTLKDLIDLASELTQ